MSTGCHYAEFEIMDTGAIIGVCDVRHDPSQFGSPADGLAGWGLFTRKGTGVHNSQKGIEWPGRQGMTQPRSADIAEPGSGKEMPVRLTWAALPGERIGLKLDCDEGTLSVFRNGTAFGVLFTDAGLTASELCWMVAVEAGEAVRIHSDAEEPEPWHGDFTDEGTTRTLN